MSGSTVLFLCPHNALRSVIASALFNRMSDGAVRGISAGTEPDDRVNERTVVVLREVGIEVGDERPAQVSRALIEQAERVISLDCPLPADLAALASPKLETWPMPDTSGKPVEAVREVRQLIELRVQALIDDLKSTGEGSDERR